MSSVPDVFSAMEFPDPGNLYSWDDPENSENDFKPTPVEVIRISSPGDRPHLTKCRRDVLHPDEFRKWTGTGPMNVPTQKLGPIQPVEVTLVAQHSLVLVIAGCDGQWKGSHSNRKRSEFGFPDVSGDWTAPFSRRDCDGVRGKLALPRATATMLERNCWAYGVSHFNHFRLSHGPGRDVDLDVHTTASGEEDGIGITMRLPGSDLVGMDAAISISHWPRSRRTHALLLCRHWCQASYVADMITHHAVVSTHPLAIPAMLCTLFQSALLRRMDVTWREVFEIEHRSGQSGIPLTHPSEGLRLPNGSCDDPTISEQAIRATQLAAAWGTYVPRIKELVIEVTFFLKSYTKDHAGNDATLTRQGTILQDYLRLASLRADSMSHRAKHLALRSKIQVDAINSFLLHMSNRINLTLADSSRKIALDVQSDSSSMKSIALLTMIFLPASYVATLLPTPGLALAEPEPWVYWAISIPLTAFVIGMWALWTWYRGRSRRTTLEATLEMGVSRDTGIHHPAISLRPIPEISSKVLYDAQLLDQEQLYRNRY